MWSVLVEKKKAAKMLTLQRLLKIVPRKVKKKNKKFWHAGSERRRKK